MDVKVFTVLFWACATWQMSVNANAGCIYEGRQLKKGSYPFETHANTDTEEKCKDICDSDPLCVIWQWQPTQKNCWIIYVDFKRDANSDFGINNCNEGKPTENAPECKVDKGNREHKLKNHWRMTREECIAICSDDSDCLIWQYFRKERLCQIHKLEVDTTKKSQVGIHYCSSSAPSTCFTCHTCGVPDSTSRNQTESRIVGGITVLMNQNNQRRYPFMVFLKMYGIFNDWDDSCGGTLITDTTIVTAAHCLFDDDGIQYVDIRAVVGEDKIEAITTAIEHKIGEIIVHPSYHTSYHGSDIAVLNLLQPLPLNPQRIWPLCLPDFIDPYYAFDGLPAKALGYGQTTTNLQQPNDLREVNLITMSNENCERTFGNLFNTDPNLDWEQFPHCDSICSHFFGRGICLGDSGGPLIAINPRNKRWTFIGVISYGEPFDVCPDQNPNSPSVSVRVRVHLAFILRNMMMNGVNLNGLTG